MCLKFKATSFLNFVNASFVEFSFEKPSFFIPKNYFCKFTYILPSSNWNLNIYRSNPIKYQEYITIHITDSD